MKAVDTFERLLPAEANPGVFTERELDGLSGPVRRLFEAAIAPDTPIATSARIAMRGRIKLRNWTSFTGTEVLAPHEGFVWAVRAGLVSGYDRYTEGKGEMRWKVLGLITVMKGSGPDVSRSGAGRCGGEAVWVPTALLPRFGVEWAAIDDDHVLSRQRLRGHEIELHHLLDDQGRIAATWFQRWGDPESTGTHALHSFGVEHTAHRSFAGLTIPSAGRAGWHYGSDRWNDGVFFEYKIDDLHPGPGLRNDPRVRTGDDP
jgi:Family of unknown function (DUF6544)